MRHAIKHVCGVYLKGLIYFSIILGFMISADAYPRGSGFYLEPRVSKTAGHFPIAEYYNLNLGNQFLAHLRGSVLEIPVPAIAKNGRKQNGWTVGIDKQYTITPLFLVGLQYDFTWLENRRFAPTMGYSTVGNPFNVKLKDNEFNAVTIGISVKL